jgi:uncharacterized protein (TIGR00730 family)
MARICVFCASTPGLRPAYAEGARALAVDQAVAAGGEVVGVIPRTLMEREIGHTGVTRLHVVDSMHERKALMADLSDAFVALPGGVGTFEELFEAITWTQLGLHRKPCGLLNVDGFYDGLLRFLDHAWAEGFIKPETRAIVSSGTDARELLQRLLTTPMPAVPQWISPRER